MTTSDIDRIYSALGKISDKQDDHGKLLSAISTEMSHLVRKEDCEKKHSGQAVECGMTWVGQNKKKVTLAGLIAALATLATAIAASLQ